MPWKNPMEEALDKVKESTNDIKATLPWAIAFTCVMVIIGNFWGREAVYAGFIVSAVDGLFCEWHARRQVDKALADKN